MSGGASSPAGSVPRFAHGRLHSARLPGATTTFGWCVSPNLRTKGLNNCHGRTPVGQQSEHSITVKLFIFSWYNTFLFCGAERSAPDTRPVTAFNLTMDSDIAFVPLITFRTIDVQAQYTLWYRLGVRDRSIVSMNPFSANFSVLWSPLRL